MYKGLPLIFLCLLVLPGTGFGQKARIEGRITDENQKPLSFVSVVIVSPNISTSTDENGKYILENVPAGTYQLVATFVGYQKQTKQIQVPKSGILIQHFLLVEDSIQLNEVQIEGTTEAQRTRESGYNVKVIETKQFENRALTLNQVLNQTAGVRIRETGGTGSDFEFSLNGLSGNQVRFFIDGIPLENYGAAFNLNNIPANLIERIEVYKGAVPIHLGADALGGAVNIITKQKFSNYLDASYSYGSFNTNLANISGQWRDHKCGFTLRPQAYFNYSNNNYKMYNMRTVDAKGNKYVGDFNRFHDTYSQYLFGTEFGFTQKKWADELMLGVSWSNREKDNQTAYRGSRFSDGSFGLDPFGEVISQDENLNFILKYRHAHLLNNKLNITTTVSGNVITENYTDTSSYSYSWQGVKVETHPKEGEADASKFTIHFKQKYVLLNTGASYTFNKHHQISTNFIYDYLWRQGRNTYYPASSSRADPFLEPNHLSKGVLGLAYQNTAWNERLQTTTSFKMYHIDILAREAKEYMWGTFVTEDVRTKRMQYGGGIATRLKLKNYIVKTSYEYTLRQPERVEIFGDGFFILTSPNLEPETSHNLNLGTEYQFALGTDDLISLSADGFLRKVDNLIQVAPGDGRFSQYINLLKVFIRGVEGEVRYSRKFNRGQILTLGGNITYQAVLNDEKYVEGTAIPNFVYRDQLYNTPSLFGNWDVNFLFTLNKSSAKVPVKLNLFYSGSYVDAFYLNYASIATAGPKNTIPTQLLNNAGVTCSVQERYHLTFECNNLTNALAYDNFAIQKPTRMFNVKFRLFLNSLKQRNA